MRYSAGWVGQEDVLEIGGKARQTRVFGENLLVERRIRTALGSRRISIPDKVTSLGLGDQPHMILYHFNFGFPLIGEKTELRLDTRATMARDDVPASGLSEWRDLQFPTPGDREQVFRHEPVVDEEGLAHVELVNRKLGVGVRLNYTTAVLPYLHQWKMMAEETYLLGLEPGDCAVMTGRDVARETGQLSFLGAGESFDYGLAVEVLEYPESGE